MRVPELRSPRTGSSMLERLALVALVPASVGVWLAIALIARLIGEALS